MKLQAMVLMVAFATFGFLRSEPLSTNRIVIVLDEFEGNLEEDSTAMADTVNALFIQKSTPVFLPIALWDRFVLQRQFVDDVKHLSKKEVNKRHGDFLKKIFEDGYDAFIKAMKLEIDILEAYKNNEIEKAKNGSQQLKELLEKIEEEDSLAKDILENAIKSCLLTSRIPFNQDEWYCTIFGGRFLLLVPKAYAQKMGDAIGLSFTKEPFPKELTDLSLTKKRYEDREPESGEESGQESGGESVEAETPLSKAFFDVFDNLFDVLHKKAIMPRWAIQLIGHGEHKRVAMNDEVESEAGILKDKLEDLHKELSKEIAALYVDRSKLEQYKNEEVGSGEVLKIVALEESIQQREARIKTHKDKMKNTTKELNDLVGQKEKSQIIEPYVASFSVSEFKTLLSYLAKKINTTVFVYETCFAAGSNLAKVYKEDQKSYFVEKHPFVIATAGVTEGVTTAAAVKDFDNYPPEETDDDIQSYKDSTITALADYESFFSMCEKDEPVDWAKALEAVFVYSKFPENIPLIKFPGTEWFMVPALKSEVLSIGKVMAATRDPKKQFFLDNQRAILLYVPEISFSLRYSEKRLTNGNLKVAPLYVSMIPGYVHHSLKNIYASSFEASRVLKSFFSAPDDENEKIFSIEELYVANDIFPNIPRKELALEDVFCISHAQTVGLGNMFSGRPDNNMVCFSLNGEAYGWSWPSDGDIEFSVQEPEKIDKRYVGLIRLALGGSTRYKIPKGQEKSYTSQEEGGFTLEKREGLIKVLEKKVGGIKKQKASVQQSEKVEKKNPAIPIKAG